MEEKKKRENIKQKIKFIKKIYVSWGFDNWGYSVSNLSNTQVMRVCLTKLSQNLLYGSIN
jgi:hypothetical protein